MKLGRIINVTVPPVLPAVSLPDMKAHLRVTHDLEDGLIEAYTSAAVASIGVDGELGLALGAQTVSEALQNPERDIFLSVPPAQSLVSVTYYDTENAQQTADLADFEFYAGGDRAFVRSDNWPVTYDRPDAVTITYTTGLAEVPADLVHAIKLIVSHWYQNRSDTSEVTLKDVPRAASHLLGLHRVGWYG